MIGIYSKEQGTNHIVAKNWHYECKYACFIYAYVPGGFSSASFI